MIAFAAHRLMELEVGALTGAALGEHSPGRLAQRNGYRDRDRGAEPDAPRLRRRKPRLNPRRNHIRLMLCDRGENVER